MASSSHTPGVIRSTRDYLKVVKFESAAVVVFECERNSSPVSSVFGDDDLQRDNPREIRNKAEKLRRDKLNQSIAELASMVPPVLAASRKIDKTSVLRLTAHYLRAHQYVFGESIGKSPVFSTRATRALLNLLNGFLLTTTYKGLVVVASQNIKEYLGYSELDLLGQSIFTITHEDDRQMLKDQLMPKTPNLGLNGEIIVPTEQDGKQKVADALASEKRRFIIRFKKLGQRTEPSKYVTCHVEGSLRMSDAACRGNRYPMVRRARARGDNPCSSGNDVVFVGIVRPTKETFMNEVALEADRLEYRTRHSIDGEIVQCEQRIALVTGYMMHEVSGVNAMNFIHKDEVRWVIVALQDMYNKNHLFGESCYRLMTKNGQFIYLRTRGRLDLEVESGSITTFVCTNTVVDEVEGKHFIKLMKEKFNCLVNNNEEMRAIEDGHKEKSDNQVAAVEDPRQLEKVILHLVTNLPPTQVVDDPPENCTDKGQSLSRQFALVAHERQRIVGAIEKIYTVLKTIPKQPTVLNEEIQPSAVFNYPPNDTYLQTHNIIETVTYNNSGASENDFFTEIPVSFNNNNQSFVDITEAQSSTYTVSNSLVPGPSTIGMKRLINYDDQEDVTRKKMEVTEEMNIAEDSICSGSPSLETMFDEELLNREIESAIQSLDQSIDPEFPDLLVSKEFEDLLGNFESETGSNSLGHQ